MPYLLDANVLIDANRDYYALQRVPQFWDWLADMGKLALIKVPPEVYDKVVDARDDDLSDWLKKNQADLVLNETVDVNLLRQVINSGYADDLTDADLAKLNEDPFLVAYALADVEERIVVTNEVSSPKKERANRKLPDVCRDFVPEVRCINIFELIRELDFRIS